MESENHVLTEQEAVELVAFLVTSARGLATEPAEYGPMRLLETARRLSNRVAPRSRNRTAALFDTLADDISTWMQDRRQDPEGAQAILDETCRAIARHLKEHEESEAADE